MKTKKYNLSAIAVGFALAMGSMPVFSADPPVPNPAVPGARAIIDAERASAKPTFNTNEQLGLCLIESVVSTLAARTNDFGCPSTPQTYDLAVLTDSPTEGFAELDGGVDVGGSTLNATLSAATSVGTRCKVDEAAGLNLLKGKQLIDYNGAHGWSRYNEIFNSDANIILRDRQTGGNIQYREVNIKDYFKRVIGQRSWEFDWGLEDIKKFRAAPVAFYYPVQKWQEASWYQHENGGEGSLFVRKQLVIPRSAYGCQIRIDAPEGSLFNGTGEFELNGTVQVGRFAGPAFGAP